MLWNNRLCYNKIRDYVLSLSSKRLLPLYLQLQQHSVYGPAVISKTYIIHQITHITHRGNQNRGERCWRYWIWNYRQYFSHSQRFERSWIRKKETTLDRRRRWETFDASREKIEMDANRRWDGRTKRQDVLLKVQKIGEQKWWTERLLVQLISLTVNWVSQ